MGLRVLVAAALAAISVIWAVPRAEAATVLRLQIDRLSAAELFPGGGIVAPEDELPTFSGTGTLTLDLAGSAVLGLSLALDFLGTDASHPSGFGTDTVHRFLFGAADIIAMPGFAAAPRGLVGRLDFSGRAGRAATGGEVVLQDLSLDFGGGLASGFCFSGRGGPGTAECIRGGGTSTGVEAGLTVAPIPLPAGFTLLLTPLLGLGLLARRRTPQSVR